VGSLFSGILVACIEIAGARKQETCSIGKMLELVLYELGLDEAGSISTRNIIRNRKDIGTLRSIDGHEVSERRSDDRYGRA
jgi:hypothetical protein